MSEVKAAESITAREWHYIEDGYLPKDWALVWFLVDMDNELMGLEIGYCTYPDKIAEPWSAIYVSPHANFPTEQVFCWRYIKRPDVPSRGVALLNARRAAIRAQSSIEG